MNSEREIIKKLLESTNISEDASILPDEEDTIIRKEIKPVTTADRPNTSISEDLNFGNKDLIIQGASAVVSSYQNANRWLDSIKEILLIDFNCPYFSKIVHDLAHSMPVSFDKFGDILHTINLKVPYPTTLEYSSDIYNIEGLIGEVYSILDSIKLSLIQFKEIVERDQFTTPLSILCDPLLSDIQEEYEYYIRVASQLPYYGDNLACWDKKAYEIYNSMHEGKIE